MTNLIVAFFLLLAGFGIGAFIRLAWGHRTAWPRRIGTTLAVVAALTAPITVVPAGHAGVVVLFGNVRSSPLHEGFHVVNPLADVVKMSVQVQRGEQVYAGASQDMQTVHVAMVINYQLVAARAPQVYQRIGLDYARTIIDPAAQEVLKATTAKYKAVDILAHRAGIKQSVADGLKTWIARYGVTLQEASLANISFEPAYAQAIERKQVQEQLAEQKRYEIVQAQREAEKVIATAKGAGDAAREQARGDADALRIKGEAEANYNRAVAESLRNQRDLVQVRWIEKWNGTLPTMLLGDGKNTSLLISTPQP